MSTPPAGAPTGAPTSAPVGAPAGGSTPIASADVVRGRVISDGNAPHESTPDKHEADLISETVLAVPGVAGLHPGAFGTVATYLPGRRVAGVAMRVSSTGQPSTEISLIADLERGLSTDLPALARRVQAAVAPLVAGPVDVTIADLADPVLLARSPGA